MREIKKYSRVGLLDVGESWPTLKKINLRSKEVDSGARGETANWPPETEEDQEWGAKSLGK